MSEILKTIGNGIMGILCLCIVTAALVYIAIGIYCIYLLLISPYALITIASVIGFLGLAYAIGTLIKTFD